MTTFLDTYTRRAERLRAEEMLAARQRAEHRQTGEVVIGNSNNCPIWLSVTDRGELDIKTTVTKMRIPQQHAEQIARWILTGAIDGVPVADVKP